MIALWNNPELIRNARSQLRPGKMLATACIAAAISLAAIGFAFSHKGDSPSGWGRQLFVTALALQVLVLAAGGGIACVNTIFREKEQNTFDFQRVTRLTPLELTLGKLFGAPVFSYFVTLCLLPLALFGSFIGKLDFSIVAAAYLVLLVASLMIHTLALLISLLAVRGAHTGAILLVLIVLGASSSGGWNALFFELGSLGPFFSVQMAAWQSWQSPASYYRSGNPVDYTGHTDVFFGQTVPHVPVLLILDALFIAWFLLALVRNIKRDSNYYEIYSPQQSLVFALYLNLLFIGFFRWQQFSPVDGQAYLLTLNLGVFFCFGLVVLRNRERFRRILRTRLNPGTSWMDFCWPAPLLLVGAISAGLIVVLGIAKGRNPLVEWNVNFAVLRSLFFAVFVARDIQFLQWMSLRRGKHPLVMGILFQIIFYVCVIITLSAFGVFRVAEATPFSAFFVPSPVYLLDHAAWALRPAIWAAAFAAQLLLIVLFAGLQRRAIEELEVSAAAPAATPAIAQT